MTVNELVNRYKDESKKFINMIDRSNKLPKGARLINILNLVDKIKDKELTVDNLDKAYSNMIRQLKLTYTISSKYDYCSMPKYDSLKEMLTDYLCVKFFKPLYIDDDNINKFSDMLSKQDLTDDAYTYIPCIDRHFNVPVVYKDVLYSARVISDTLLYEFADANIPAITVDMMPLVAKGFNKEAFRIEIELKMEGDDNLVNVHNPKIYRFCNQELDDKALEFIHRFNKTKNKAVDGKDDLKDTDPFLIRLALSGNAKNCNGCDNYDNCNVNNDELLTIYKCVVYSFMKYLQMHTSGIEFYDADNDKHVSITENNDYIVVTF